MTATLDPPAEQAQLEASWITPGMLDPDELHDVCEGLEAVFAWMNGPDEDAEDKRDFPFELSALLRATWGQSCLAFGMLAGDGSLLAAFDPAYSFGIEPDAGKSRKRRGGYTPIVGDIGLVADLMEPVDGKLGWTVIDLTRECDPANVISTTLGLLHEWVGVTAVAPLDFDHSKVEEPRWTSGLYAELTLADLGLKVTFWVDPERLDTSKPLELKSRAASADTLDLLGPWVTEQRKECLDRYKRLHSNDQLRSKDTKDLFLAVHREYGRRHIGASEARAYDVFLKNGVVSARPSGWTARVLSRIDQLHLIQGMHNRNLTAFAQQTGTFDVIERLHKRGLLRVSEDVLTQGAAIVHEARRVTTPLFELPKPMRLGWLDEVTEIECIRDDPESDFKAGEYYPVYVNSYVTDRLFTKEEPDKDGVMTLREKKRAVKYRSIRIGKRRFQDTDLNDVRYLVEHFELPNRYDIGRLFPADVARNRRIFEDIQREYLAPRLKKLGIEGTKAGFKPFQQETLARLKTAGGGILAWEQGLGKTLGALAYAEAHVRDGAQDAVLFVVPQDLIPQWQREAKKFFGRELTKIGGSKGESGAARDIAHAREVAKEMRRGGSGWFITYYEALSQTGRRNLWKKEPQHVIRIEYDQKWVHAQWVDDPEAPTGQRWIEGHYKQIEREITSATHCPRCGEEWNGSFCRNRPAVKRQASGRAEIGPICGHSAYDTKTSTVASILSTAFVKGVIVVDEGTQIAGSANGNGDSQKSLAVRGLRSRNKLLMTGTPIKNFIGQAFWLLWWALSHKEPGFKGGANKRFAFPYQGGKSEFQGQFSVKESTKIDGVWTNTKIVGEVTNLSALWKMLASSIARKTKETTGEKIVAKKLHTLHTPLGYYQREQLDFWRQHFTDWFKETHPKNRVVKSGAYVHMAHFLGLHQKWNWTCLMPQGDNAHRWTSVPVSNFTPAALTTLETVMRLVAQGRKVLVGADLIASVEWLTSRLAEKGVLAENLIDSSGQTLSPAKRSKVVERFQEGETQVLVATIKSIRLGHNLDAASAVVFHGLEWDFESFSQFEARVHRLTSKRPVDVYVTIPGDKNSTIVGAKWDVLKDKAQGALTALDGSITEPEEEPLDAAEITRQLMERGIPKTGNEVMEATVEKAWMEVPSISAYKVPEGFVESQAVPSDGVTTKALAVLAPVTLEDRIGCDLAETLAAEARKFAEEQRSKTVHRFGRKLGAFTEPYAREDEPWTELESEFVGPAEVIQEEDAGEVEQAPAEKTTPEPVAPVAAPAPAPQLATDLISQIRELAELHKEGLLDADEFKEAKAVLIAQSKAASAAPKPATQTIEEPAQLALGV